ncbi:amidase [Aeromicrobium panaciterrae]|uniref:Amidase n=1 Tax=Aeromicrobium panaciterrae TaxID=363861 RepID=A0ABU1UJ42_9ACTN|nr:amidase [Aeromicrobium panaciterrae]MDR7085202.1 amidase [Aeromicrobium panaciterrae]
MAELHELDAIAQSEALRARDVSSVELVEHHLDRIASHSAALGAFITVTAEQALERAAIADAKLTAGDAPAFTGVPIAIKDLTFTRDIPTSMGSVAMRDFVPPVNAYVVDLIEKAGFVSLGKTNTPEFGLSSYTDNDLIGPARTPWDTSRNAGGSSGGAAAAVAAGLVPLAQGSDGGGSIRIPASACGIIGFKPSRGRVSAGPLGSDWSGLAVDGPLTRTVRDAAALLDVLAHPMPGDIRPLPDPAIPYAEWSRREPGSLRIARWSATHLEGIEPGPDALAAFDAAGALLESLGHEVVDIPNPFPQALEPQFNIIWSSGIAGVPLPPEAEATLRTNTRYWRARGATASAIELSQAMQFLEATTREVITGLQSYDALLTPTLALPPQPNEWFNESGDPIEDHHRELLFTPYTALYNMSGQPAASLPLHWSAEGLPIGVMLAAMPGQDGALFSLCAQLEAAAPWADRRPTL